MPDIQPNPAAIAVAVVFNFFLGYAWYTPLFGKVWARELGLPAGHSAQGRQLAAGLLANLTGCVLVAVVLSHNIAAWTPSTWGVQAPGMSPVAQGVQAAVFTWLGFYLPPLLNALTWEKRGWRLTAIHGGYYFASLLAAAQLIVHMR